MLIDIIDKVSVYIDEKYEKMITPSTKKLKKAIYLQGKFSVARKKIKKYEQVLIKYEGNICSKTDDYELVERVIKDLTAFFYELCDEQGYEQREMGKEKFEYKLSVASQGKTTNPYIIKEIKSLEDRFGQPRKSFYY